MALGEEVNTGASCTELREELLVQKALVHSLQSELRARRARHPREGDEAGRAKGRLRPLVQHQPRDCARDRGEGQEPEEPAVAILERPPRRDPPNAGTDEADPVAPEGEGDGG